MRMDNNVDANGEETPPPQNGTENVNRQSAADLLDDIIERLINRHSNNIPNGTASENAQQPQSNGSTQLAEILQQVNRAPAEIAMVEGIDAASPLGRSLQRKFTELEEISHRLKTRLNQVVCESDILLSPDVDADQNVVDFDLERDLNTDSHAEDLTPQEFFQLVQSQMASTSNCSSSDNSDKSQVSK